LFKGKNQKREKLLKQVNYFFEFRNSKQNKQMQKLTDKWDNQILIFDFSNTSG